MIWLIILLALMVSFTFSGIEAGILSVNRVRLRHRVKSGDKAALVLDRLLSHPDRMVVSVLLVTNGMNLLAISLSTLQLVAWLGTPGYWVSAILWWPVYLLGLGIFPKALFRRFPFRALAAFSNVLRVTDLILSPLLWLGIGLHRRIIRPGALWKLFVGRDDFKYLTLESERVGKLSKITRKMIHSVVDFHLLTARELMIPMSEVQSVASGATVEDLLGLSIPRDIDRLPVLNASGEVTGAVDVYEILLERVPGVAVGAYQRRIVTVVPESSAFDALKKMRVAHSRLALVADPEGQPLGILRLEDLIGRLVKT